MNEKGFVKLPRKFFSTKMWKAARTFSECEAWIDLIQSARFEATVKIECIGGREIQYGKGQYPASIRFLSKRWNWGEKKVRVFLSDLKKETLINIDNSQGVSIITIIDYNEDTAKDTVKDTSTELIINELNKLRAQLAAQQMTQQGHSKGTNSKKEEEREENIIPPLSPKNEEDNFLSSPLSQRDGKPRNLDLLLLNLQRLKVSQDETNIIVKLSNQGEVGHPVWGILAKPFKGIKMPGRFIISELKKMKVP